jgi:hypothetical protein
MATRPANASVTKMTFFIGSISFKTVRNDEQPVAQA